MGLISPVVGIVGGTGRMGSWLAGLLRGRGLKVLISGRKTELAPIDMAGQCDVVVISVPISETERVISEIGPMVPEQGLLMDLASVKRGPVEAMLRYSRAEVVGLHPLFGPGIATAGDLRVAVCPGRGERGLNWISRILGEEGFRLTLIEPAEHDRIMGLIQGANHFATLAFALCICDSNIDFKDLLSLSTQTFLERLERIRAIIAQPAELFRSLMADNPSSAEFIGRYLASTEKLAGITRDGSADAFERLFESLKNVFDSGRGV